MSVRSTRPSSSSNSAVSQYLNRTRKLLHRVRVLSLSLRYVTVSSCRYQNLISTSDRALCRYAYLALCDTTGSALRRPHAKGEEVTHVADRAWGSHVGAIPYLNLPLRCSIRSAGRPVASGRFRVFVPCTYVQQAADHSEITRARCSHASVQPHRQAVNTGIYSAECKLYWLHAKQVVLDSTHGLSVKRRGSIRTD